MHAQTLAPIKINLALHVVGRAPSGLHRLESLVAFLDTGDQVELIPGRAPGCSTTGPWSAGLDGEGHTVATMWRFHGYPPVHLRTTKHIPHPAGLGGGTSDAAAAARLLTMAGWAGQAPSADHIRDAIGTDWDVCAQATTSWVGGFGETVRPAPQLPPLWAVVARPPVDLRTQDVYAARTGPYDAPLPPAPGAWGDIGTTIAWLRGTTDGLFPTAERLEPLVGEARAALASQDGCLLARMSGSGAACFGLFASQKEAEAARQRVAKAQPGWWTELGAVAHTPPTVDVLP